jgi:hypothetical protein
MLRPADVSVWINIQDWLRRPRLGEDASGRRSGFRIDPLAPGRSIPNPKDLTPAGTRTDQPTLALSFASA